MAGNFMLEILCECCWEIRTLDCCLCSANASNVLCRPHFSQSGHMSLNKQLRALHLSCNLTDGKIYQQSVVTVLMRWQF